MHSIKYSVCFKSPSDLFFQCVFSSSSVTALSFVIQKRKNCLFVYTTATVIAYNSNNIINLLRWWTGRSGKSDYMSLFQGLHPTYAPFATCIDQCGTR